MKMFMCALVLCAMLAVDANACICGNGLFGWTPIRNQRARAHARQANRQATRSSCGNSCS